uniref:peptide-methionine (R)-S-oxide reductase n=1 Tax=Timema cristinae TaxID=61476 RepID=A0A7R9DSY1_TIMCR|nr:unnamed protein product [Timema cristinae]
MSFFRAFTGKFNKTSDAGTYVCLVCRDPLFSSETKYDSGCGWPAFNDVLEQGKVKLTKDTSNGNTTINTPSQDSNLNLSIISSLVFCRSDILDHAGTKASG